MKCPKCGYIGFEATDRCRNCGYEFTLAASGAPAPDLPMRTGDDGGPLTDLSLQAGAAQPTRRTPGGRPALDLDRVIGVQPPAGGDLPLFDGGPPEPEPMITAPAAPRRPLAVRRATPEPIRVRRARDDGRHEGGTLDLPLPEDPHEHHSASGAATGAADPLSRMGAALVDLALLGGIDVATVYFTLRLCGLPPGAWGALPLLPLAVFFLLVNGGYLATFTAAGGQTIGKMAFGLKVVGYGDGPVSLGLSSVRALGAIASTICLGAGLLPALMHREGRAVHDRLADTHVVKVDA